MLHGIKIGGLVIENPVALAPMAGVGDSPFRNLVAGYGEPEFRPSFLVSEMVSSKAQTILLDMKKPRNARVERMMRAVSAAGSRPQKGFPLTSVQIFGSDPAVMARSARLNEELGAAMIDINMGCPVGKIIKSGSGSDLLKDPALAERIVEAVARAVKIPVGVKMRTGWDDKGRDAAGFARMLESSGASMIAVHGRTRSQFYSGPVDFDSIAAVKRAVKVPVIGNGDITSPQLAREMMEKTGCDGVMIGRGACGAPWILSHVVRYLKTGVLAPEPSLAERRALVLAHVEAMADYYGERVALLNSRKHVAWYSRGMRGSSEFRAAVNSCACLDELRAIIGEFFA